MSADDWPELYSWQNEYRKKHKLTSCEFLRIIGLEPRPSLIQYLKMGDIIIPSSKKDTIGRELRNAFNEFKILTPNVSRTLEQIFNDFLLDNESYLSRNGLLSVVIKNINEDVIDIEAIVSGTFNEEFTRKTLKDFKLGNIRTVCLKDFH